MPLIQPFRALRPAPGRAAEVLAPPYDVLSSAEARERASGKPWSFLHISKPEIDLDPSIDVHDPRVYARAAENLRAQLDAGVLMRDAVPAYYAYRLTRAGRTQTGLACVASIADYETNRIRKHELTTPVKEDDRVHQIEAINAETGPVMMGYRDAPTLDALLAAAIRAHAHIDVTADDGVRHEMWPITDPAATGRITALVDAMPAIYIADGHHRSAAAARVARARGNRGSAAYFLSVLFPEREMLILDYNRVLRDLNGHTPDALLAALRERFTVEPAVTAVKPRAANEFGMFVGGRWYRLTLAAGRVPTDPVGRLPVTLLADNVLAPLFGVTDQRTDKRIDFVGGGRGLGELERRILSGEMAAGFALYPTEMADLMAVADAGKIMPPKSTWFEPKLADGVVSHVLD